GVLTADRSTADFFDEAVKAGGEPKRLCNIITQTGLKMANEKGCGVNDLGITPQSVARLAGMIEADTISANSSASVFEVMVETGKNPEVLAEELNLIQKSDAGELEGIVDQVLADNPNAVEDVTAGGKKSKKARGFLLGQVMQKTKGQANPKVVSEILDRKLG
ncbi:MAG: Asp-tRNA(Asn)/Glu-tRNA(Gln) amidotransferase subunit GatB, partial [Planctomycetota bacterium]